MPIHLVRDIGYAPVSQESALDDATMAVISREMDQMLRNHEPHPELLMDRHWNSFRTDTVAQIFFNYLIDLEAFPRPCSFLEMTFDPAALRPCAEDRGKVAASLLHRVRREALGEVINTRLKRLMNKLKRFPGADKLTVNTSFESLILPIILLRGDERISYF